MLNQVGLRFEDLRHIYIAGGFGRYLDLENATIIGLIPDLPRERFRYIGNSSLMGSYMVVVSQDFRQRQLELARRMTYLELNTDPAYIEQYTGALFLPQAESRRGGIGSTPLKPGRTGGRRLNAQSFSLSLFEEYGVIVVCHRRALSWWPGSSGFGSMIWSASLLRSNLPLHMCNYERTGFHMDSVAGRVQGCCSRFLIIGHDNPVSGVC